MMVELSEELVKDFRLAYNIARQHSGIDNLKDGLAGFVRQLCDDNLRMRVLMHGPMNEIQEHKYPVEAETYRRRQQLIWGGSDVP